MKRPIAIALVAAALATLMLLSLTTRADEKVEPHAQAQTPEEAGRYLIRVSGCNDCHTPGFMQMGDKIPESLWLTGVPVGWRGPWGTTYASNLRLFVKPFTEDQFVQAIRSRNGRPPMPWTALHAMTDQDLKSIYRYIKSLGDPGQPVPASLPPGEEPKTPFINALPVMPAEAPAAAQPTPKTP